MPVADRVAAGRDIRRVLERLDPDGHGQVDRGRRVGVDRDPKAGCVRQPDHQPQVFFRERRSCRVGSRGVHPAAGHDLHCVDAALDPVCEGGPDLVGALHLTAQVVTVPGREGEGRSGRDDPGEAVVGSALGIPAVDHIEATVPEVAHSRDARGKLCLQRGGDDGVDLVVGVPGHAVE